jgi:hypothetical protein
MHREATVGLGLSLGSFRLVCRDLLEVLEFIHSDEKHLGVYSHRIFGLLLRACTDFESICKSSAIIVGIPFKDRKAKIGDFCSLPEKLQILDIDVEVRSFLPEPYRIKPFHGWVSSGGIDWYQSYNSAKHDRALNFDKSNLRSLISALAACFLLLVGSRSIPLDSYLTDEVDKDRNRVSFAIEPFTLITQKNWQYKPSTVF